MDTWISCCWVALGGGLGALSRFGIANLARRCFVTDFPLGTFAANLLGCFFIGLLLGSGLGEKTPAIKFGVGVGFLGSLTTFSTFSAEAATHLNKGQTLLGMGYVLVSLFAGLLLAYAGMAIARSFRGAP